MTIKRVTFIQELLSFMGLAGRVQLEWISSAEAQKFAQVVSDFTEKIKALGPNPLKAYDHPLRAVNPELILENQAAAALPIN